MNSDSKNNNPKNTEDLAHFFREMVVKRETSKTIEKLEKNTEFSNQYLLLSVVSSVIASIGVLQSNVLLFYIGLTLSPYVFYLGFLVVGVFMKNKLLLLSGFKGFMGGFLFQIFFSFLLTVFIFKYFPEAKIEPDAFLQTGITGDPLTIIGASVLGFAALYCFLRFPRMEKVAGIGVSFFLVPTLISIGIALALENAEAIINHFFPLIFNLLNLVLGACLAFSVFGFSLDKNDR